MKSSLDYYLPADATTSIDALLDQIEAQPGDLINPLEIIKDEPDFNLKAALQSLPPGITEDDLIGILKLAMLTECGTDSYAAVFYEGAKTYNAPWLERFTSRTWVPDEYTHTAPFKSMLLSAGFDEAELNREIAAVQGENYEHCCGKTPVELTTYGLMQEYLTDNWHGLIAALLKPQAPTASYWSTRVKRRETLHCMWYRDMTAIQVGANPDLIPYLAESILTFKMPGAALVPQHQSRVMQWMPLMGADFPRITKELFRHFHSVMGNVRRSGELALEILVRTNPGVTPKLIKSTLDKLGGPGYGLIGEAMLEKVGLPLPDLHSTGGYDSAMRPYLGVYERLRGAIRSFIVGKIDTSFITSRV
jgi:hypothetical protein